MSYRFLTLSIAIGLGMSSTAQAQPADAEELPVMQVDAQALDDFQQTAIMPSEQNFVPGDPADLLKYAPGASVNKNGVLTGIEQYRGMYGSRVNTLVNGLNVSPAGPNWMDPPLSHIPSADLADIAVIRGISPVSEGSETIGGTIRANARTGEFGSGEEFEAHGIIGAGGQTANSGVNGNALLWTSNQHHRFQVSGSYLKGDDVDAGNNKTIIPSETKRWSGGVGYGFQDDAQTAGLSYQYDKTGDSGTPALPMDIRYVNTHSFNADYSNSFAAFDVEAKIHYIDADHKMDNYTLRSAPQMINGMRMRRFTKADSNDTAYDLRATTAMGQGEFSFGTDGWLPENNADVFSPDNSAFKVVNYNNVTRNRFGLFGEWQGELAEGWDLTGGARYTRVNSDADKVSASGLGMNQRNANLLSSAFNAADRDQGDNLFDLALILSHSLNDSMTVEIGAARKQRAPSYQERYLWLPLESTAGLADGRTYVGDINLDPETAYNFDLGLNWTTERFYFTPRVFYKRVNDYIQGTPLSDGAAVSFRHTAANGLKGRGFCQANPASPACQPLKFSNVDAEFYGADAGIGLSINDNWRIDGTFSYVRGKRRDISDNLYRIAPANSLLDLSYLGNDWSVTAEGEFFAKQDKVSETNAEQETDGYALLNLYGQYNIKDSIQLRAGVRNVLDNFYQNHLSGYNRIAADANGNPSDLSVGERLPGAGRNFFVQAEYRF